ncbi:hypothetical protein EBU99_11150 [bacterium]|nr:hypothetical protein [bacterium]
MRNWSLNRKVLLVGLIFVATSLGIAMLGIIGLSRLEKSLEIYNWSYDIEWILDAVEQPPKLVKSLEAESILEPNPEHLASYPKRMADIYKDWDNALESLGQKISDSAQKGRIDELRKALVRRKDLSEKVLKAAMEGDTDAAFALHDPDEGPAKVAEDRLDKLVDEIVQGERATVALLKKDTATQGKTWIYWMSLISLVGLGGGLILAYGIMMSMNKNLSRVAENLFDSANQVMNASQHIALSSSQLSHSATTQASSLEETAASVEELASMVNLNAGNARKTSEVAVSSTGHAEKGKFVVESMVTAMEDINKSNNDIMSQISVSNQQIEEIVKVIGEIGNKTKIINDIVFQTKLLSFNASVEAARAGEHGKGFAVVAEEVGNLAQMSGNAAKEISAMLEVSIQKVETIVHDTQSKVEKLIATGREKIELGSSIAAQCGVVLSELVDNSGNVAGMAGEISAASSEQSLGITEINKAMGQLEQMTQQGAASSEECAAAAEELSAQAESMRAIVRNLVTLVKGAQAQTIRSRMAADPEERISARRVDFEPTVQLGKPRLQSMNGRMDGKNRRPKPSPARRSGEEILRKAAGAEDIPMEHDPRFLDT